MAVETDQYSIPKYSDQYIQYPHELMGTYDTLYSIKEEIVELLTRLKTRKCKKDILIVKMLLYWEIKNVEVLKMLKNAPKRIWYLRNGEVWAILIPQKAGETKHKILKKSCTL